MAVSPVSVLKRNSPVLKILVVVLLGILGYALVQQTGWLEKETELIEKETVVSKERTYASETIQLPTPRKYSNISVEQAIQGRRSRRSYLERSISLAQLSQMLWAAQGITAEEWGGRAAPSAKSAYPLEITVVAKDITGLEEGVYHYLPQKHQLKQTVIGVPEQYDEAAVQSSGQAAPAALVVSADFNRMTEAFEGETHDENVYLEAGHAAQNLYLQAESLRLGMVVVGGFNHELMQEVLQIPSQEELIYLIPVGWPAEE